MYSLYHGSSKQLCYVIAVAAKQLYNEHLDQIILQQFMASRLIQLAKNPGFQPKGFCETLQRIISKTKMEVLCHDIQIIAGSRQLCARQRSGCEDAILAMRNQLTRSR